MRETKSEIKCGIPGKNPYMFADGAFRPVKFHAHTAVCRHGEVYRVTRCNPYKMATTTVNRMASLSPAVFCGSCCTLCEKVESRF